MNRRLFRIVALVFTTSIVSVVGATGNADAALPPIFDSSFGVNGQAKISIPKQRSDTAASELHSDSAGNVYSLIGINTHVSIPLVSIAKFSADGVPVSNFGTDGRTQSVQMSSPSMSLQPDGKILLFGLRWKDGTHQLFVYRYLNTGLIDTTFATNGVYTLNSLPGSDLGWSKPLIAVRSDGSLVIGLTIYDNSIQNSRFYFLSLNQRGRQNYAWASAGVNIFTPTAESANRYSALLTLTVLADDSIIAVGSAERSNAQAITLIKLTDTGWFDQNFDGPTSAGNGVVFLQFASEQYSTMSAITILSDGSFVLAGHAGSYVLTGPESATLFMYYGMAKVSAAGIPDTGFSTDGFALSTQPFDDTAPYVSRVFVETNGGFVFPINTQNSAGFMRVTANGTTGSGSPCSQCFLTQLDVLGSSLLRQSTTGNLVLAGQRNSTKQVFLARLTESGALDSSFSSNSYFIKEEHWDTSILKILPLPNGDSFVIGRAFSYNNGDNMDSSDDSGVAVFKMHSNGTFDENFDNDGVSLIGTSEWSTTLRFRDAVLQADGKLVILARQWEFNGDPTVSLTRILPDGSLDATFGIGGVQVTRETGARLEPTSLVATSDNSLFVSVTRRLTSNYSVSNPWIFKYTSAGILDPSFTDSNAKAGKVHPVIGDGTGWSFNLYLTSSDKILITGDANFSEVNNAVVARLNSDGSFDTSFSGNGYIEWPYGQNNSPDGFSHAVVSSTGVITLLAYSSAPAISDMVIQLRPDGTLNPSFGTSGILQYLVHNRSNVDWVNNSQIIESDGAFTIIGVGSIDSYTDSRFSLVSKITANGNLLTGFGTNGVVNVAPDDNAYLDTIFRLNNTDSLIAGDVIENNMKLGIVMKIGASPVAAPSPTTPETPSSKPGLDATPTTTVPAPTTTTVPVKDLATEQDIQLVLSVSQASILKKLKLTVPKGGKVTMKTSTARVCRVVKTKVQASSTGTCRVSVTMTVKGKKTTKALSFKVT